MKTVACAWFLLVAPFCAAVIMGTHPLPCAGDEPTPAKRVIDELIAQLGDESFAVREAATKQLMEREDAIPALSRALKSRDAEVARRAREIRDVLARREKERAFARLADLVKCGAVDQAVEKFVRREKWDDETAGWQLFAELAGKLTDREREAFGKASLPNEDYVPARDFRRYAAKWGRHFEIVAARRPSREQMGVGRAIRAEEIVDGPPTEMNLIISAGNVKACGVGFSVIFAGGSVDCGSGAQRSLIVCDGYVEAARITDSLVIARGPVVCSHPADNSRIISGGNVVFKQRDRVSDSKLVENERKPLGFIQFFDPAEVGIKVGAAEGGVRVKEAAKGKPFAEAGLQADDVVTALDGEAVKDAESFRRLLRAKLAVEGTMTFKVRRGDKAVEVAVPHKD
jgi:hypothetical protein